MREKDVTPLQWINILAKKKKKKLVEKKNIVIAADEAAAARQYSVCVSVFLRKW